jgi:hypothetical protein
MLKKKIARQVKSGRPGLGPVENTMANAENMTVALALAPIAGAAAALIKAGRFLGGKDSKNRENEEGSNDE